MPPLWWWALALSFVGWIGGQLLLDEIGRRWRRRNVSRGFARVRRVASRVYDQETVDGLQLVMDVLHARSALDETRAPLRRIRAAIEEAVAADDPWEPLEELVERVCLRCGVRNVRDRQVVLSA